MSAIENEQGKVGCHRNNNLHYRIQRLATTLRSYTRIVALGFSIAGVWLYIALSWYLCLWMGYWLQSIGGFILGMLTVTSPWIAVLLNREIRQRKAQKSPSGWIEEIKKELAKTKRV